MVAVAGAPPEGMRDKHSVSSDAINIRFFFRVAGSDNRPMPDPLPTPLERLTVHRLRVPLEVPYRLAFGPVEWFDTVLVEAVDRDGRTGFGEATILTGYTDETIEDSWRVAREFAPETLRDRDDLEARIAALGSDFPFTATAFGTALEMLRGSALLTLERPAAVPLVGLLNAKDPHDEAAMRAELDRLLDAGFRTIKVKVGFAIDDDIALIRAVQNVVTSRALIRIDANQAYTAEEGVRFMRALDPADIELFEQPCAAGDWDAHLAVARVAPVPMMLDESIYGMPDIERAAELGAATYIKLKLMKLLTLEALANGIDRIRALGMQPVLGNGVACDPGCWMEGCIAARKIGNAGEMNGWLKARGRLFREPLGFADGAMRIPANWMPRLDAEAVARFAVEEHTIGAALSSPRRRGPIVVDQTTVDSRVRGNDS
jgi:L-alanine-DL-glutamate epimerase-like enolase superfamily enzyme